MLTSAAYWIDSLRKLIFFSDLVCQFCILYSVTIVQLFFFRFIALNLFQTIFLHCKHVVSVLYLFYFCLFILFCVCIVFILFCDILLKFHAIDTFLTAWKSHTPTHSTRTTKCVPSKHAGHGNARANGLKALMPFLFKTLYLCRASKT